MPIDLHAHTTASDGSFSPLELVAHAQEIGLSAVAITDHDTFGGHAEALAAGADMGVEIVPGIELSVSDDHGKFHLLGYFCNQDSELNRELAAIQYERANRNEIIIARLQALGFETSLEKVRSIAGEDAQIGRPHIARSILGQQGLETIQQVFDELLADGGRAHAPKKVLSPARAVELIHEANGVAIWAHPLFPPSTRQKMDYDEAETLLKLWKSCGLDGLEIYYGLYTAEDAEWARAMAQKYELIGTGGSDFHGITKPTVYLGQVNGGVAMPESVLEQLKSFAAR
jgi:predicted metal-dependent phosphoesterase TrpH